MAETAPEDLFRKMFKEKLGQNYERAKKIHELYGNLSWQVAALIQDGIDSNQTEAVLDSLEEYWSCQLQFQQGRMASPAELRDNARFFIETGEELRKKRAA